MLTTARDLSSLTLLTRSTQPAVRGNLLLAGPAAFSVGLTLCGPVLVCTLSVISSTSSSQQKKRAAKNEGLVAAAQSQKWRLRQFRAVNQRAQSGKGSEFAADVVLQRMHERSSAWLLFATYDVPSKKNCPSRQS
jgi:hypothetical protein